ncbi:MAG: bifunctional UDP-N-acetylmuramoyl-tripeptide:D-alanyl-D-alanine ligase/alanine racemase, partial [Bacteroidota bacterium]|nr:bifunctional UDP-N-acetylmuramoyl-tripeptide:D-alanyl-D-alanine ligase/alanine racemase [Bacteroidota bacterium]
ITGSNGKTIVKEWLFQLLNSKFNIVRSPKSYNSQIGVPLSLLQMSEEHTLGIFEAGISMPGEMKTLSQLITPRIGIITNIGPAHDEYFHSWEEKLTEKLRLFINSKTIIYNGDDELIDQVAHSVLGNSPIEFFTWGHKENNALRITSILSNHQHTIIEAVHQNETLRISIPFTDKASIENVMHCWATMIKTGVDNEFIAEMMPTLTPIEMRLELKEGINNCSIINDSYSSDLYSLSIALDFLDQQQQHPHRTIILSDILQSGKKQNELYTEVAILLKSKGVNRLIGIGPAIYKFATLFDLDKSFYASTEDFLQEFDYQSLHNETILLKGARIFEFEKILERLQQKAHETVLEINLDALIHNLNFYRSGLHPGVKMMTMVKAFSYGSGGFEIANMLQYYHVDYLTVAYADEGIELRKGGISMPIMVMNPEELGMDGMIRYHLEPEIYSFRILDMLKKALEAHAEDLKEPFPVHIKFDTGMHRLGFERQDLKELILRLKNSPNIKVCSAFSHLAGSDDPSLDYFTEHQIALFKSLTDDLRDGLGYDFICHILNSSGIRRFPSAQFNMVRLGIGLYGVAPYPDDQEFLQNVSTLKTIISQTKFIQPGDTIGYGRSFKTPKLMKVAVIPIGYADGLSRRLSNGVGKVWVNGKVVPIIGTICMDMCMIDITDVEAREGDTVIIFGKELPIQELANALDTIPYEILTGISRRVKRIYFQE